MLIFNIHFSKKISDNSILKKYFLLNLFKIQLNIQINFQIKNVEAINKKIRVDILPN